MGISVDVERSLQGFSLHIEFSEAGKRIGILGASGSGKSMTLKMIAGIVNPDKGKIVFDGTTFYEKKRKITMSASERISSNRYGAKGKSVIFSKIMHCFRI